MFDMHEKLNKFYDDHVRLGQGRRQTLAAHRDSNLERLKAGLEKLEFPTRFDSRDQGSYAMYTINQHPDNHYDIDVAIIFAKSDLPSTALSTRKRIEEAMLEGGGNFSKPPEALTNAVRVYYQEGHHVDLAIYRQHEDYYGTLIHEHAGSEWSRRDPMELTNWFNATVRKRSPSTQYGATVEGNQMRRIVRWLKAFAKSRENWDLPGGLIVSILVAECYRPHPQRDDVALHDTMSAIFNRLHVHEKVWNPVHGTEELTSRPVDQGRVRRFREKLDSALSRLEVLHDPACTEGQAVEAWGWVFQHPFWEVDDTAESMKQHGEQLSEAAQTGSLFVGPTGRVLTKKPEGPSVRVPRQKFYAEE